MESPALSTSQLKNILEVSRFFAVTADLDSLLLKIIQTACALLRCERASIWLHDPVSNELYTTVILQAGALRVPADTGIVGAAFQSNRAVTVHNVYEDSRFNPSSDRITGFVSSSLMAVPMLNIDGKPVGVIQVVNKIDSNFTQQDEGLMQLLADQAGVAIQRHHLQELAGKAAEMHREMKLARAVQLGMTPKVLPAFLGYELAAWAKPASTTGGDCYDLWALPDDRLGIFLADASGHGLAPAMVVSQARALVRSWCDGPTIPHHPHDVLTRVNHRMSKDLDPGRLITAFLGFLSSDGTLQWQSAGQGPVLVRQGATDMIQSLGATVPPIRAMDDLPDDVPGAMHIHQGGLLAILSDGIFEAYNPSAQQLGAQQVISALSSAQTGANAALRSLIESVDQWQQRSQTADDQTAVIITRDH